MHFLSLRKVKRRDFEKDKSGKKKHAESREKEGGQIEGGGKPTLYGRKEKRPTLKGKKVQHTRGGMTRRNRSRVGTLN